MKIYTLLLDNGDGNLAIDLDDEVIESNEKIFFEISSRVSTKINNATDEESTREFLKDQGTYIIRNRIDKNIKKLKEYGCSHIDVQYARDLTILASDSISDKEIGCVCFVEVSISGSLRCINVPMFLRDKNGKFKKY